MKVKSPITSGKTKLVKKISRDDLEQMYQLGFGISIKKYIKDLNFISIYKCLDTGYQFYHPFTIYGDENFYKHLESYPWYYRKWKWEYELADTFIKSDNKILEIGCGSGHFLSHLKKKDVDVLGLELNNDAIKAAGKRDVKVLNVLLEDFVKDQDKYFDVVCAFQVLEHIWDIDGFIKDCIKLLEPKGKLIFAVPNNQALFFKNETLLQPNNDRYVNQLQTLALNRPPHHMGLWNKEALENVAKHYADLNLIHIEEEPVNSGRMELNNQILSTFKLYNKYSKSIFQSLYNVNLSLGDSLLVVYEKE